MKIGQPYRCDGPGCKKLREDDTNHWWLVSSHEADGRGYVQIEQWDPRRAKMALHHACGIDCAAKISMALMAKIIESARPTPPEGAKSNA